MPSVYEIITARIVDKLEAGTVPWHKPWNIETGAPRNLTSGRPYRGINVFLLGCQSYASRLTARFGRSRWGKERTELLAHYRHTSSPSVKVAEFGLLVTT